MIIYSSNKIDAMKKRNIFCFVMLSINISFLQSLFGQDLSEISTVKPITISGAVSLNGQHYHSSYGNTTGRPDVTGYLNFSPTVTLYGVQFPFNFYLTTSESSFRQPFNEFGVSPRYRWITGHFGYRSVQYSQYSLAYQRWLGAGIDLRFPWLRISMMYGRFQKAAEEDTTRRIAAIYKRMGSAFKVGFGSDQSFVDINYFRGWDDGTSVSRATYGLSPTPAENAVLSIAMRLSLLNSKIRLETEVAGSAYTRDINAPEESKRELPSFTKIFLTPRTSTEVMWALRSSVNYNDKDFRLSLKYERIEPDFQSMGVGYITGDREDITIAPSLTLFRNLRINGSVGIQRNNLLNDRLTTSRRLIWSCGVALQAIKDLGVDLRYSNHSSNSSDGRIAVTDTTRIENVSQSFNLGSRYSFGNSETRHSISLFLMYQDYVDRNLLRNSLNNNNSKTATLGYNAAIHSYIVSGSISHVISEASTYKNTSTSFQVSSSRYFFDRSLSIAIQLSYSIVRTPVTTDSQFLPGINVSYRLSDRDSFTLHSQLNQNTRTNNPYTEIITSAGYMKTF